MSWDEGCLAGEGRNKSEGKERKQRRVSQPESARDDDRVRRRSPTLPQGPGEKQKGGKPHKVWLHWQLGWVGSKAGWVKHE